MESMSSPAKVLPSLDRVRTGLESPPRRRPAMWVLILAALFAAVAGVSAAGVMIFGPGEEPGVHSVPLK